MDERCIEYRIATDDDWVEIWPIVLAVVRSGDTYVYSPDIKERDAQSAWMLTGSSRAATYVATLNGEIVATATLKPNQPGLGDHIANAAWVVAPAVAGRGIGRGFAQFVINEARRLSYLGMQFNAVVATNARAIALWESLGFTIVGTVPRAFRHSAEGFISIHIMHRDISSPY
jgi:L-amino acid N-acyltransferase YncA